MEGIMYQNYSVLMSVYVKENAEYFQKAIESIFAQTVLTDDFVLVCDGPLNIELNQVIAKMQRQYPEILHVIRLEKNMGLGNALNYGIKQCKNELIARMDSDDISRPDRCEKQLEIFKNHEEISIVSGTVEEFDSTPDNVTVQRVLPEKHNDIIKFAQKRNPFNHPCVMYKKSAVEVAGGYQDFYLLEDYYLWVRMLQSGSYGYNLQICLLWMRAGESMYKRRSGQKYAKAQRALFKYMYQSDFITKEQYRRNSIVRTISSLVPNFVRKSLYALLLRKKVV